MKLSRFTVATLLVAACMSLASCASKEERLINDMTSLVEKVEKIEDAKELEPLVEEYQKLIEAAQDCNMTEEQSKEFAKLSGKFTVAMTKGAVKGLPGLFKGIGNAAEGVIEGIEESME